MEIIKAHGYNGFKEIYINPYLIKYVEGKLNGSATIVFKDGARMDVSDSASSLAKQLMECDNEDL